MVALDLKARTATDARGEDYRYERLLLATGGRPRRLPFEAPEAIYLRTLADYRRLRSLAGEGASVAVIGGGFVGSELAAALAANGCRVTLLFPGSGIAALVLPRRLAAGLVDYYREQGVEAIPGARAAGIEDGRVLLADGRSFEADAIAAGVGSEPEVSLAAGAGLETADGIVVDRFGRAAGRSDVFAAGEVARFPDARLGGRLRRVEHDRHAVAHGRSVGANMAGAGVPYEEAPLFYSDLFDVGYEAVGEIDARLPTASEVEQVRDEGAVYYLDSERRPLGVLLWNLYGRADDARALIDAGRPLAERSLR